MTQPISRRAALFAGAAMLAGSGAACAQGSAHHDGEPTPNAEAQYDSAPARNLTDAQWRAQLQPASYNVLRHESTEHPFSSPLNDEHRRGVFACAGCALPLFQSAWKFDSGTGWPSFFRSIPGALGTKTDLSVGMERIEYHCARCLGHQGHLFPDGPAPTGLRYCNNGVALTFTPA